MTREAPTLEELSVDIPSIVPMQGVYELERPVERSVGTEEARRSPLRAGMLSTTWSRMYAPAVYAGSRIAVLVIAGAVALLSHHSVGSELEAFDGQWYLRLAAHGYPTHPTTTQSTLGFFPLYPLAIRAAEWLLASAPATAALILSLLGGLVATVLVQRLATAWWGERTARRATLLFALFPGSIVFSMAYSECLTLPLVLGCLLCLRTRRFVLAGLLAGLATAVEPVALAFVVACAMAAYHELRTRGWHDREALSSLSAPLLSTLGIGAFAVFLWCWTGTPFAAFTAQHAGWFQQADPLGIFGTHVARELIAHPSDVLNYLLTWNLWNGIGGAVFLLCSLFALRRVRHEVSRGAIACCVSVAVMTLWSVMTPPNARMTLVAVPAVIVWARRLSGWRLGTFIAAEAALFVVMSAATLSGHMLP